MTIKKRAAPYQQTSGSARTASPKPKEREARTRECVPCEIPPFCRTNFFTGRLLTEQDFTAEQRYFRDKLRLHYRVLHGWGVACGLRVKPHPYCPDRRLVIEPGLAIDQCGYEIFLAHEVEIELPPAPTPPAKPGYPSEQQQPYQGGQQGPQDPTQQPPYPGAPPQPQYAEMQQQPQYPEAQQPPQYSTAQSGQPYPASHTSPHYPHVPNTPLYVCLKYAECETDFMPAPFDECGCNDSQGRRATRICESYNVSLEYGTPPPLHTQTGDCEEILREACEPCPAPTGSGCIPLAHLPRYVPGQTVTDEMIDNRSYRPLIPSAQLHDRLIRCILPRVSLEALTRVCAITWTHGQEYSCTDFIRFFTGSGSGASAFEVEFDRPVRPECLTPRVFQAVVTRFGGASGPGGPTLEVAPTRVWPSSDRRTYSLQIDRDYAERELRGRWFDVYLTLRCNLVLDERGRAVDGELIAHMQDGDYVVSPPTGNGVPGGSLESWIRVRP
jgi:hypothetical protein